MKDEYLNIKETPITFVLVIANILTFVVLELFGDTTDGYYMLQSGAMNPQMILGAGQWYRLASAFFLHFGIEHLANNMLLLFFLGQIFERAVGSVRFLGIYLGSGLSGSFFSFFFMCLMGRNDIAAGASGAIFGIVGGMVIVILVHKGKLIDETQAQKKLKPIWQRVSLMSSDRISQMRDQPHSMMSYTGI